MQTIDTFAQLDMKLAECDDAVAVSDDALRAVFHSFQFDFASNLPEDPFSKEYAELQMALYRKLSGKDYAPQNEVTHVDPSKGAYTPFPFCTRSAATAGDHLMAVGFAVRHIKARPGARIVDFGAGWGNTSIALASLGFDVTVVEIEERFCELIRQRAAKDGLNITVVNDDFFWAETIEEPFDVALFHECFHHCADHMRLLRALKTAVKPDGLVYFSCEPITDEFPIPWGLRMDGESLWAIRKNGWLELGFNSGYFRDALAASGWRGQRITSQDIGWVSVWEARRFAEKIVISGSDERLRTQVGSRVESLIHFQDAGPGFGLFGPYLPLGPGRWSVRIGLAGGVGREGQITVDICTDGASRLLAKRDVNLRDLPREERFIELEAVLDTPCDAVEVRIFCHSGVTAAIDRVEIERQSIATPSS